MGGSDYLRRAAGVQERVEDQGIFGLLIDSSLGPGSLEGGIPLRLGMTYEVNRLFRIWMDCKGRLQTWGQNSHGTDHDWLRAARSLLVLLVPAALGLHPQALRQVGVQCVSPPKLELLRTIRVLSLDTSFLCVFWH